MTTQEEWDARFDAVFVVEDYHGPDAPPTYSVCADPDELVHYLHQRDAATRLKTLEEVEKVVKALKKIDKLVSADAGFEADCYLGLDKPRGVKPKYADEWAEIIMKIYKITHPLLHECCGGTNSITKLKGE
jgi:hypothetical protein